jgi:multidrug efflux pump
VIALSTIAKLKTEVVPESITRFQQQNSATLSGVSGQAQGEVLQYLEDTLKEIAPSGYTVDYAGPSRQFSQESGGFGLTMLFAVIIVFLTLAALFESFRDPVVILVSVPLALFGAMIFIFLGFSSINIYTEVGLVTLMGLISKHGILIVEVANDLRNKGASKLDAIVGAAEIRLRPILMTTAAMVFGVIPLVIASGAGAAGRHAMGLVIFTGLSIGTCLPCSWCLPCIWRWRQNTAAKRKRQRLRRIAPDSLSLQTESPPCAGFFYTDIRKSDALLT